MDMMDWEMCFLAGSIVCYAGNERYENKNGLAGDEKGARGSNGVFVGQSPAGLSGMRSGWRVRLARSSHDVRQWSFTFHGHFVQWQASRRGQESRPVGENKHEPMHTLHEMHPFCERSGRRRRSRHNGSRRWNASRHVHWKTFPVRVERQRRRPVSCRSAHVQTVRFQSETLGVKVIIDHPSHLPAYLRLIIPVYI